MAVPVLIYKVRCHTLTQSSKPRRAVRSHPDEVSRSNRIPIFHQSEAAGGPSRLARLGFRRRVDRSSENDVSWSATRKSLLLTSKNELLTRKSLLLTSKSELLTRKSLFLTSKSELLTRKSLFLTSKSELLARKSLFLTSKSELLTRKSLFLTSKSELLTRKSLFLTSKSELLARKSLLLTSKSEMLARKSLFLIADYEVAPYFQCVVSDVWNRPNDVRTCTSVQATGDRKGEEICDENILRPWNSTGRSRPRAAQQSIPAAKPQAKAKAKVVCWVYRVERYGPI